MAVSKKNIKSSHGIVKQVRLAIFCTKKIFCAIDHFIFKEMMQNDASNDQQGDVKNNAQNEAQVDQKNQQNAPENVQVIRIYSVWNFSANSSDICFVISAKKILHSLVKGMLTHFHQ